MYTSLLRVLCALPCALAREPSLINDDVLLVQSKAGISKNTAATNASLQDIMAAAEKTTAEAQLASARRAKSDVCNIFTLWEYPKGPPLYVKVNLESWRRHSDQNCQLVMVNDSNVLDYIPDMPEEYFRMPYPAAKSDLIRYGLIYHNGGIYMDTDFLVNKAMDPIVSKLQDTDFISYENEGQACKHGTFSSNFMAGRKGSAAHLAVWEAQKAAMQRHCPESEEKEEHVCCFDNKDKVCHIPWTQVGEGISHNVMRNLLKSGAHVKMHCFGGPQSFVPRQMGWLIDHARNDIKKALAEWEKYRVLQPLDRIMYHQFNSMQGLSQLDLPQLFNESTLMGAIYQRSFFSK